MFKVGCRLVYFQLCNRGRPRLLILRFWRWYLVNRIMITYNFICIDLNNELRRLASNEGATYDFPMIIGSSSNTEIYSFSYAESEGKIKVIAFILI